MSGIIGKTTAFFAGVGIVQLCTYRQLVAY